MNKAEVLAITRRDVRRSLRRKMSIVSDDETSVELTLAEWVFISELLDSEFQNERLKRSNDLRISVNMAESAMKAFITAYREMIDE